MTTPTESGLTRLRHEIDALDDKLIELLAERLRIAGDMIGHKGERSIRDPERERRVVERQRDRAADLGIDAAFVETLFASLFNESIRAQERRLRREAGVPDSGAVVVAYQGVEGAYSELAARRFTGGLDGTIVLRGYHSFAEVVGAVQEGAATHGCLPIENTRTGSIAAVHDLIIETGLSIVGEEVVDVTHCLLGVGAAPLAGIRQVVSHPQALDQCSRFLADLVDCKAVPHMDTADAARVVAERGDPSVAALASEEAGHRYGLTVLRRDVSDRDANLTRFVVVARDPAPVDPRIECRTTMVVAVRHEHGALAKCLTALADQGLNLTRIESRPRPNTPWRYVILLDFLGNTVEPHVRDALAAVEETVEYARVLGSYPIRVRPRNLQTFEATRTRLPA